VQKVYLRDWEKNMDINTYEIILTEVAKEELEFIYEYISKTLSAKKAADNLMEKIEKTYWQTISKCNIIWNS